MWMSRRKASWWVSVAAAAAEADSAMVDLDFGFCVVRGVARALS